MTVRARVGYSSLLLVLVAGAALLSRALPVVFAANGTITFVQVNSATPHGAPTTVTATYSAAQTAGNLNVVVIGWGDATASVASVTDSKNNTYTVAAPVARIASPGLSQTIYYARNIAAAAAGTNTVTVTFDGGANYPDVRILEYNGADLNAPVDVTAVGTGTGTTSTTPAVTTTTANDLLFAANVVATVNTGPGTGFTQRIITADGNIAEDRMVSAVGSYSATATLNAGEWIAQMVAFRAAAVGPDTTPPTAPSGLTATAVNGTRIDLSWTGATDNVGVTGYQVERCQGAGCVTFAQILTPTTTSVSDTTVAAGINYSYRVLAVDAAANVSGYSNVASATTPAPDTTAPTAPSGLTATAVSSTRIDLSWTASTDNVAVAAYQVDRCQGAGCATFAQILTPTTTSVSDTTVAGGISYSYRVRAVDAANNVSGNSNTASATTPDTTPPTVPAGLAATAVNGTRIDLIWSASTDDVGVTGYRVERCQGAGCATFAQILTPTGTSVSDTTVVAGNSYSYRVFAVDAAGNVSGYSNVASATTPTPDTTPPTAPGTPTATVVSSSQINLGWSASTDDVGVTGYRVERCQGAGCSTFAQVLTPTGTTVSDTGLLASTSYSYRVLATDAAGNLSGYSATVSATTAAAGNGTITFVQVNSATPRGNQTTATVTYTAAQTAGNLNVVVIGWGDTTSTISSVTDSKGNSYVVAVPLTRNTNGGLSQAVYYARNIAAAAAGTNTLTVAFSAGASFPDIRIVEYRGADLTAPVDVTSSGTGSGTTSTTPAVTTTNAADLLFATNVVSTANTGPGAGFTQRIITADGNIVEDQMVSTVGSYTATATLTSGQWIAQLVAFRAALVEPDTTPPTAPAGLTATAVNGTRIDLSWTAATDNVGVTGYRVERCQGTGCATFAQILTPTTTSVSDTTVAVGTSYSYRVLAVDAAGNLSGYSNVASATTPAPDTTPPTAPGTPTANPISSSEIDLGWPAATDNVGVTGYRVERCVTASCVFAQIATPASNSFNDTGLTANTNYSYRVRATDAAGNLGPYSAMVSASTLAGDTTPPTAPGTPVLTVASSSRIDLVWVAATDTVGVTGYMVERCAGVSCGTFTQIATPTASPYSDTGVTANTSYTYRVRATDAAGNLGPYSPTASATTPAAPTAVTFVQISAGTPAGFASSVAVPLTAAQAAGNINVVIVGWNDVTHNVTSVVDSKGNNYLLAAGPTVNAVGNGLTQSIYYAKNIAAAAAGANSVTVTFDGSTYYPDVRVMEYAGADPIAPIDATAVGTGDSSASSTAALTTTGANHLLVAGNAVWTMTSGPGQGFTQRTVTADGDIVEDMTAATPGSYAATAPLGSSGPWVMQMVALRPAGGGPPPVDTTAPTAPTNPTATPGSNQIIVSWTASTDNLGVTGYFVERCQSAGCSDFAQIATPVATTLNDLGLLTSTTYSYRIRATDGAGNMSAYSSIATATTSVVQTNPVVLENQKPGSSGWMIGDLEGRPYTSDAVGAIKGYASAVSVNKGENIAFYVRVSQAQPIQIDVYRIGWYGGLGGRLMHQSGSLSGVVQAACPMDSVTGMTSCNWTPTYTMATQTTWTSGVYLAVIHTSQFYNYIPFVVRDDSRVADFLYQQPVTTYNAYNSWGGKSLYEHNSSGANTIAGTVRAVKVSFDRPYADEGSGLLVWLAEINFVRWAEKQGYDISYSTDVDTHTNGTRLLNYRGFLSLPHDEYWSKEMYDAAVTARDAGVNQAYLGANSVFWQIRFEASGSGVPNRVVVCYKDASIDPNSTQALKTVQFRDALLNRPEQTLVGVMFTNGPNSGWAPWVAQNTSHWAYAGTGFQDGNSVAGIVGYEADRDILSFPPPTAVSGTYVLLSSSPYTGSSGADIQNTTIYQAPSGAWVFASGTMAWGWALDDWYPEGGNGKQDARIQKMMVNILNKFIGQ